MGDVAGYSSHANTADPFVEKVWVLGEEEAEQQQQQQRQQQRYSSKYSASPMRGGSPIRGSVRGSAVVAPGNASRSRSASPFKRAGSTTLPEGVSPLPVWQARGSLGMPSGMGA